LTDQGGEMGGSPGAPELVCTWIAPPNLEAFAARLSEIVRYSFDDGDWDALRVGVVATDEEAGTWYDYDLAGTPTVHLLLARADCDRLAVKAEAERVIADRIHAVARVMRHPVWRADGSWVVGLVAEAFADRSYPGDDRIMACDPAHLKRCPECKEALAFFKRRSWLDLACGEAPLPTGFAGLPLLSEAARAFFFSAYLATAMRRRDAQLLDLAQRAAGSQTLDLMQEEVLALAARLAPLDAR
jgi:hypothetical protein